MFTLCLALAQLTAKQGTQADLLKNPEACIKRTQRSFGVIQSLASHAEGRGPLTRCWGCRARSCRRR